jgi:hypothetical protein
MFNYTAVYAAMLLYTYISILVFHCLFLYKLSSDL